MPGYSVAYDLKGPVNLLASSRAVVQHIEVSAFTNLRPLESRETREVLDSEPSFLIHQPLRFIYRTRQGGITFQEIRADEAISFFAGSVEGFEQWIFQIYQILDECREEGLTLPNGIFRELLEFTGTERVIGTQRVRGLSRDFALLRNLASRVDDVAFQSLYRMWQHAFRLASDNGFVRMVKVEGVPQESEPEEAVPQTKRTNCSIFSSKFFEAESSVAFAL